MLTPRVIPCLLLQGAGLVKTLKFSTPRYVGDVVNAVKIFNEKEVDEIFILDIAAHKQPGSIQWGLIGNITSECFMPVGYGGGIRSTDEIRRLFGLGIEKVSINTSAIENPKLIEDAARLFGSQSVVAAVDVKRTMLGSYVICSNGGSRKTNLDLLTHVRHLEKCGAGELLLNSIDRDGTQSGYDINLIKKVSRAVSIPVVACGGAGSIQDCVEAVFHGGASGAAAGSLFVFHGKHRAVLITYPSRAQLDDAFRNRGDV